MSLCLCKEKKKGQCINQCTASQTQAKGISSLAQGINMQCSKEDLNPRPSLHHKSLTFCSFILCIPETPSILLICDSCEEALSWDRSEKKTIKNLRRITWHESGILRNVRSSGINFLSCFLHLFDSFTSLWTCKEKLETTLE